VIKILYKTLQIYLFVILFLTTVSVQAEEHQVIIKKFKFIPAEITIKAGDSITWQNEEKRQYHSVWFEQSGEPETDYFFPGETYSKSFNEAGSLPYRCGPHPEMTGIVNVK
jgi:plastocyanin